MEAGDEVIRHLAQVKAPPLNINFPMVSVLITTFNSAKFIARCLESLQRQTYQALEIIVVDNDSTDRTRTLLQASPANLRVILNESNVGFAAAQNQAARIAKGEWLLSLNPDVILAPDFIANLIMAAAGDSTIGTVCGKLLRWHPEEQPEFTQVIDSTGIYFTPDLRHLDRGAGELDRGQYGNTEFVFGATGAAALYSRSMIDDVSVDGQFFDEDFFSYREDADLAWRAQLMGWKCLYVPQALGWHVRRVTPERRRQLPLAINFHSIKNRFLMRAKNIAGPLYRHVWFRTTVRDIQVIGYCVLVKPKLLGSLHAVWKLRGEIREKRRTIQSRRRVSDPELAQWFSFRPVSMPVQKAGAQGRETRPAGSPAIPKP